MKNDATKGHNFVTYCDDDAECSKCGLRYASWWRKGKKDECQENR